MQAWPDIRRGAESDIPAIAGVHLQASKVAYRGICPDEVLSALTLAGRIELWRRRYERLGPEGRIWVSQQPNIVGFAVADRVDALNGKEKRCELLSLYVLPECWGRKVGYDLMRWLLDDLRERDFDEVLLWTIRDNWRARDFYERIGFDCDDLYRATSRRESGVLIEYEEIRYSRDPRV